MQAFSILPDPRTGPAQRHDLQEMIVMALSSVLCGADNWVDVAEWSGDNEDWLKKYLILKMAPRPTTPSGASFDCLTLESSSNVFATGLSTSQGLPKA